MTTPITSVDHDKIKHILSAFVASQGKTGSEADKEIAKLEKEISKSAAKFAKLAKSGAAEAEFFKSNPMLNPELASTSLSALSGMISVGNRTSIGGFFSSVIDSLEPGSKEAQALSYFTEIMPNGNSRIDAAMNHFMGQINDISSEIAQGLKSGNFSSGKVNIDYDPKALAALPKPKNKDQDAEDAMFKAYEFLLELMQTLGENSATTNKYDMENDQYMADHILEKTSKEIQHEKAEQEKQEHQSTCQKILNVIEMVAGAIMDVIGAILVATGVGAGLGMALLVGGSMMLADGILSATGLKEKLVELIAKATGSKLLAEILVGAIEMVMAAVIAAITGGAAIGLLAEEGAEIAAQITTKVIVSTVVSATITALMQSGALQTMVGFLIAGVASAFDSSINPMDPSTYPEWLNIVTTVVCIVIAIGAGIAAGSAGGAAKSAATGAENVAVNSERAAKAATLAAVKATKQIVENSGEIEMATLNASGKLASAVEEGVVEGAEKTAEAAEKVEEGLEIAKEGEKAAADAGKDAGKAAGESGKSGGGESGKSGKVEEGEAPEPTEGGVPSSGPQSVTDEMLAEDLEMDAEQAEDAEKVATKKAKQNLLQQLRAALAKAGKEGNLIKVAGTGAYVTQIASQLAEAGINIDMGVVQLQMANLMKEISALKSDLILLEAFQNLNQLALKNTNDNQKTTNQAMITATKEMSEVIATREQAISYVTQNPS